MADDHADDLADADEPLDRPGDRRGVVDGHAVDARAVERLGDGGLHLGREREEVVVEHDGADRGALVGRDGADLRRGLHEPTAVVELRLLGLDLLCAIVELRLLGGELLGAGVELGLLGLELRGGLVVRACGLRLRDGGIELRLVRVELRLAGVELGLAVVELLRGGVELRLAVVELLFLVGAIGCRGERVDGVGDAVELADVGEERADLLLLLGGEGRAVLGLEDDRSGRAAEARQLVAELRVDALGLGAGDAHAGA